MAEALTRPEPRRTAAKSPAAPARERRSLSTGAIIGNIVLCLVAGHLVINAYFPSPVINGLGLVIVTGIIGRVLFFKRDPFAFVLVVFFCAHFQYANHQGGLFNLVGFLLGSIYLVIEPNVRETRARDPIVFALWLTLLLSNLLGLLLRNPMPFVVKVLEGSGFTAVLVMFWIASHLRLTAARLRSFVGVSAFMIVVNFLVSLNQHYGLVQIESPLLALTKELFYATTNSFGIFGSASSNGQWAMMMIALLAPLVAATSSKRELGVKPMVIMPVLALCALTLVLANMRAAAVEAIVIVLVYVMMFSALYRRFFRNSRYLSRASIVAAVFLVMAGTWVGLQNISRDFQAVQVGSVKALESGEALNRGGPWQFGMKVLETGNWWVGYGHGNDKSNLIAWGGKWTGSGDMDPMLRPGEIVGGGHFHNLYLALPTLYGWVGAFAYVMLLLLVIWRLFGAFRRHSLGHLSNVACLGFLTSLSAFALDEIKSGNAVQTINFALVAWVWLGLGLASWRTLRMDLAAARAQRAAPAADEAAAPEAADEDAEEEPGP